VIATISWASGRGLAALDSGRSISTPLSLMKLVVTMKKISMMKTTSSIGSG
jgi:hypothetical protein